MGSNSRARSGLLSTVEGGQILFMAITYKPAGVDLEAGKKIVQLIARHADSTRRRECRSAIGGFAGLFNIDCSQYRKPVLVSSTDGVGTKLLVAQMAGQHDGVGIDLVAMGVNDIIVTGAEPIFFLDYISVGKINLQTIEKIVEGIAEGCRQAGCALLGGETAEMPGLYGPEEYDLAGFAVGIVEAEEIIDGPSGIEEGDSIIALASSGLHSNGYSLVRKILFPERSREAERNKRDRDLLEILLKPTRIYVRAVSRLKKEVRIKGIAHITGGGIPDNLSRILPPDVDAEIYKGSWPAHDIFQWISQRGGVEEEEMFRVFNMGLGLVILLDSDDVDRSLEVLKEVGEKPFLVGRILSGQGRVRVVEG
ncbi:phosphoribosylformylglycinamidine cyclo-ligase [Candidatus Hakubella thermalkaliphila]|uniref:Phosphoribosylformylglycinamidine cyclo-ligase n=3 Tax=Candidatus Hakubella thermalkaliphila TaxID=2754717 RepID=A0A6V8PUI7_9ACTN|nr:phosphoribosylformylglycinamidine cyclo-ligase [Candidatus Hakubella thermalkaliphila]GFP34381.1 phosphoribosylformylglycinamidine cyclo-ligase [Candidatus Hakubella thermalkaliphila]GFP41640.1 phosphoribosylformylglycinamidine cyclo-ligase [Candidatus Hakubella thermalkaliphila]